ncbi:MAG: Ig-like domain-containing protein [Caldilineaceae bacterium]
MPTYKQNQIYKLTRRQNHYKLVAALVMSIFLLTCHLFTTTAQAATDTPAGSALTLDLAAAESVTIVSNGANYTFTLGGAATWSGTDSANVTGNGTGVLTVIADAFTEIAITDSGAGASVTFGNSAANTFSDSFTIVLDAGSGAVTIANSANLVGGSSFAITADTLNINAALGTAANADISLYANVMDIQAAVSAGTGIVTLAPLSNGCLIDLGSATDAAANTLELSDAEIDRITAGVLRIGSANAGSITFSNLISPAGTATLSLITGDEIVDGHGGSDVQVSNLAVQAVNGIADTGTTLLDTAVETIAARNTTSGAISLLEASSGGDLIVGAVDGVVGIRNEAFTGPTPTLGIQLETNNGNLTINSDLFNQRRNIFLVAQQGNGSSGDRLFTNNAHISTASANGEIRVDANNMTLANGSTITAPRLVRLNDDPGSTMAIAINLGGGDGVNTLGLTDAELSTVSTNGILQIGSTKTDVIDVTAPIDLTDGPNIPTTNLISGGAILGSGGNVLKTNALNLTAATTIGANGDPLAFNATALTTVGNGNQYLAEADSVTIGDNDLNVGTGNTILLSGGAFVTTGNGALQNDTTVMTDATLMGAGIVNGAVTVQSGGELAPGASPGIINTGAVTFQAGSTFTAEINGVTTPGSDYDQINVTGAVAIDSAAVLAVTGTVTGTNGGDTIVLINNDGSDAVAGNFAGLPSGTTLTVNGQDFRIYYDGGDGNDVVLVRNDTTPPVITYTLDGTLGDNGWYISDVAVTWTVTDSESAITGTSGCTGAGITNDTANALFTCVAISEGGRSAVSVPVKRDATPPTANAGGPYGVAEGSSIQLDGGGTSNNGPAAEPLRYGWDFDGDGQYDDAAVITPTFAAATLDGPSVVTVGLRVTDGAGLTDTVTTTIGITNVAPMADAGPDQSVFRNQVVNLTGVWSDPVGVLDNAYSWSWDLDGDHVADSSGSANYGDSITSITSFTTTGVVALTFTVTDKDGGSSSDTVQITVTNRAPLANDQNVSTTVDAALPITLTGADADGDVLSYVIVSQPDNGALSGTAPNLTYTPNAGFTGSDSFTFVVNDGLVDSTAATVNIAVNPVNSAPVANGQNVSTDEDMALAITLTATDADNDVLAYSIVTPPTHGTLGGLAHTLVYTPDGDFNGSDTFTFKANDGQVDSVVATITITVQPVNDPPLARDDSASTAAGTPVTITVQANDSAGPADEDPTLTTTAVSEPLHGAASINADGTITYQPAADVVGDDSFTYTVCDSDGACATATVRITVTAGNGGEENPIRQIFLPLVSKDD